MLFSEFSSGCVQDATEKLPIAKAVTSEDAEEVRGAEQRNKADMIATAGGVADTMATAAKLNRDIHTP